MVFILQKMGRSTSDQPLHITGPTLMKSGSFTKNSKHPSIGHFGYRVRFFGRSLALTVAIGFGGMAGMAPVHAQATSGRIFGWAPAGQIITVYSTSGIRRHSKANTKGRYNIGALPMGVYEVTLNKDDKAVDKRSNIKLMAGGGAEVDFACEHDQCAESTGN